MDYKRFLAYIKNEANKVSKAYLGDVRGSYNNSSYIDFNIVCDNGKVEKVHYELMYFNGSFHLDFTSEFQSKYRTILTEKIGNETEFIVNKVPEEIGEVLFKRALDRMDILFPQYSKILRSLKFNKTNKIQTLSVSKDILGDIYFNYNPHFMIYQAVAQGISYYLDWCIASRYSRPYFSDSAFSGEVINSVLLLLCHEVSHVARGHLAIKSLREFPMSMVNGVADACINIPLSNMLLKAPLVTGISNELTYNLNGMDVDCYHFLQNLKKAFSHLKSLESPSGYLMNPANYHIDDPVKIIGCQVVFTLDSKFLDVYKGNSVFIIQDILKFMQELSKNITGYDDTGEEQQIVENGEVKGESSEQSGGSSKSSSNSQSPISANSSSQSSSQSSNSQSQQSSGQSSSSQSSSSQQSSGQNSSSQSNGEGNDSQSDSNSSSQSNSDGSSSSGSQGGQSSSNEAFDKLKEKAKKRKSFSSSSISDELSNDIKGRSEKTIIPSAKDDVVKDLKSEKILTDDNEVSKQDELSAVKRNSPELNKQVKPSLSVTNWRQKLKKVVLKALSVEEEYSPNDPSRRLEGAYGASKDVPALKRVALLFDGSGSMSADKYRPCIMELEAIGKIIPNKLQIFSIIWSHKSTYPIRRYNSFKGLYSKIAGDYGKYGGGGTDPGTAFEFVKKKFGNRLDTIIIFTDGEFYDCNDSSVKSYITRNREKVIWVLCRGGKINNIRSYDTTFKERLIRIK